MISPHRHHKHTGELSKLEDDAYHFASYRNRTHLYWYGEYWYFNFQDPVTGRSGILGYVIFNPRNDALLGRAALTLAMFEPGGRVISEMDFYGLDRFWASDERADVTIGQNVVRVLDEDRYQIQAATKDGRVAVDLVYTQADRPTWLTDDVQGHSAWENNSWVAHMPNARVQGTVTVNGRTSTIERGAGYHDHSWGTWLIPSRIWGWALFYSPERRINCDLGYLTGFDKSQAYFRHEDLRVVFPDANMRWTMDAWQSWGRAWKYPTRWRFESVDATGKYKLDVAWRVTATAAITKSPILIFEQTAEFDGALYEADPGSQEGWKAIVPIAENGHCEWVTTWYEPLERFAP